MFDRQHRLLTTTILMLLMMLIFWLSKYLHLHESFVSLINCKDAENRPPSFDSLPMGDGKHLSDKERTDLDSLTQALSYLVSKYNDARDRTLTDEEQKLTTTPQPDLASYKDVVKYAFTKGILSTSSSTYSCDDVILYSFAKTGNLSRYVGRAVSVVINNKDSTLYAKQVFIEFESVDREFMLKSYNVKGLIARDKDMASISSFATVPKYHYYSPISFSGSSP
jgi:hypothetical protein